MSYSDEQMHPSQNKFYTFAYKINTLNMEGKDLNRLNTVSKWSYHSA